MHLLTPNDYHNVLHCAELADGQHPIIRAVLENRQDGQVLIDIRHLAKPFYAVVCHKYGFLAVLVRPEKSIPMSKILEEVLYGQELTAQYRLWYDPPLCIMPLLQRHIEDGKLRVRERIRYKFSADSLRVPEPPASWAIRALELRDLPALVRFRIGFPERFWRSADDFFAQAFAVVAEQNGEVVSICYPAAIGGSQAEVDVATLEHARGKGFAYAVTYHFIREAMQRGVEPTWDCFTANEPSVRLAQRFGFKEIRRYPFVTFNRS